MAFHKSFFENLNPKFVGGNPATGESLLYRIYIPPSPPGGKLLIAGFPVVAIMVENLLYNTRIGFPILQLVINDVLTLIFFYIGTYKQSLYGV